MGRGKGIDRLNKEGRYILTGSVSADKTQVMHTGAGRINMQVMYSMSLYESGESNGSVLLSKLGSDPDALSEGCVSELSINDLIYASCRAAGLHPFPCTGGCGK